MDIDKQALDKYLTTEPDNGFEGYSEQVIDKVPDEIYNLNPDWFNEAEACNTWLAAFHRWGIPEAEAAKYLIYIFKFDNQLSFEIKL